MAQGSTQEKTESATAHRLKKAREEGQVPQVRDFVTTVVTVLGFVALLALLERFGARFSVLTRDAIERAFAPDLAAQAPALALEAGQITLELLGPLLLVALVAAPVATVLGQGGFAPKPFKIQFQALDVIENAKQKLSQQNLFEFFKALLRFVAILGLMWLLLREQIGGLFMSVFCGLDCGGALALRAATQLVAAIFAVMAVLALIDLLLQRRFFAERQKMSKDEVKREHKDLEGDPQMKGARKQAARRALSVTVEDAADYATAVLVDGAGRVVAVIAQAERGRAPQVIVALGAAGSQGERLVAGANARGKPVITDPTLVRPLMGLSGLQTVGDAALAEAVARRLSAVGALR